MSSTECVKLFVLSLTIFGGGVVDLTFFHVPFSLQTRTTLQGKSARHFLWTTPSTTMVVTGAQGEDHRVLVGEWVEGSIPQHLVVLVEGWDMVEEGAVRGTSASSCPTAVSELCVCDFWIFCSECCCFLLVCIFFILL